MELHRCRFVPYNPQAINALEFSHPASSKVTGHGGQTLRLAVGRANGDIEIWNPLRGAWFQETIIRGGKGRSIEGLAWTLDPLEDAPDGSSSRRPGHLRLFSIGYTNTVTEWDLATGRPARHSSGSYGEIWCLTAQPRWSPEKGKGGAAADGEYKGQHLAIGCADGSIVILSTSDNNLTFVRRLHVSATKNVRVLSITFQNRNVLAAGYADSSIRLFDIRSGRILRTVSLGRGPVGGPKDILVWSVKCLPDGTLVSGDSTGEIRFWDAKNFSLIQRLRSHQADVLDLAVSIDGETVISGGVDCRTVLYQLKPGKKNDKSRRWAEFMNRRYHTHDVKKFAVYESRDMSIAVSGGPDASLVVLPLRQSGKEHHRTLSNLPQICQLVSGSSSRLVTSFWEREVRIWRIQSEGSMETEGQRNQLVGRILIPGDENITSAALSSDGSLLVLSTMTTIRIFSLSWNQEPDKEAVLNIKDLKLTPQVAGDGARVVSLSPDLQWLSIIRPSNKIFLVKLSITDSDTSEKDAQIQSKLMCLKRASSKSTSLRSGATMTLGDYDRTIRTVTFSSDSKLFATGDLSGFVDLWVLEDISQQSKMSSSFKKILNRDTTSDNESSDDDNDDEIDGGEKVIDGQKWKSLSAMPCLRSGIVFMSFRPVAGTGKTKKLGPVDDRLIVLNSNHQLTEYEALKGKVSEWSQRNPKSCLPKEFVGIKDRAIGGICDIFHGSPKLLLYGPTWMWMFDLTQNFPSPSGETNDAGKAVTGGQQSTALTTEPAQAAIGKRKREDNDEGLGKVNDTQAEGRFDPRFDEFDESQELRRKYNSGAGDLIPKSQATVSMGTKVRKIERKNGRDGENGDDFVRQWIEVEKHRQINHINNNDEDEGYDNNSHPFLANGEPDFSHLHRQTTQDTTIVTNGIHNDKKNELFDSTVASLSAVIDRAMENPEFDYDNLPEINFENMKEGGEEKPKAPKHTMFWHSYKFRDILGVVPLGSSSSNANTQSNGILSKKKEDHVVELAVVERPMWDMDLGERYVKDHD